MGAILLIENDQNVQGLIKKILPKGDLMVFNKFGRDREGAASEIPEGQWLKASSAMGLEDAVREYLKAEMGAGQDGSIHEFIIGKVERALIGLMLEEEKGNQVRAAKRLGINRNTLRKKMKDLRIIPRVVTR